MCNGDRDYFKYVVIFKKDEPVCNFVDFINDFKGYFIKPKATYMTANYIVENSSYYKGTKLLFFTNKEGIELIKERTNLVKHEKSRSGCCTFSYVSKKRPD